nr:uncharacterized protein LOC111996780 [Quercus suber]
MANSDWMLRFAGTMVHHLPSFSSDHCPIWIVPRALISTCASKPFRFEEMWLTEKGCTDTIQAVWAVSDSADPGTKVIKKVERCGIELKKWSLKNFGSVRRELELKKKEIVQAEREAMRSGQNFRVRELMFELNKLMDKEARMWLQRSKVQWAKYGDRNSRYFHARATQRFRKNSISNLKKADGMWCSSQDEVADTIVAYFQDLFTSARPTNLENTTQHIYPIITDEMNASLVADFDAMEVQEAIKQMAPLKAPGPDANRLKKILPNIITENQSAFTKSRLISDNILVAFESLHSMQRHTGKDNYMAIKLDMSKAYDRVEWCYLEAVMRRMGFDERWVRLMMTCITTISYSILINGEPKGMIVPTRGIRQGDPLSPFLFLLCTEGLNGLISQAANHGKIKGYALCRNSPRLTHLLFADDSLLFCRATEQECNNILEILDVYGSCSGQQINRNKTTIFFSKLTSEESREYIKQAMEVSEIKQYEKYLGLPSFVGKRKKASFNFIKEKVWRKLQGWEEKLLSQAGREILIKAVVQAIPTYTMSCFKLPLGLCSELESLIRKFWWGQRGDRRKIHWVNWETLTQPKSAGGMGFKDLALFNDALLAKQAWRLLHSKESLLYKVFKSKFFPTCSFMEAPDNSSGSYAWRSLLKGREVLWRGARWRVGTGETIKIWDYSWLPSMEHPRILSPCIEGLEEATVDCLINPTTRSWDRNILTGYFAPMEVDLILKIPLSPTNVEDKLIWPHVPTGVYSVKSGYRFLAEDKPGLLPTQFSHGEATNIWRSIWRLSVPNKVKNFLWRACKEALPVKKNLVRRRVLDEDVCCHCKLKAEDGYHALWDCSELSTIWETDVMWLFCRSKKFTNFFELARFVLEKEQQPELFASITWTIWSRRNQLRTSNRSFPLSQIIPSAKQMLHEFSEVHPAAPAQTSAPPQSRPKWEPPPPSLLKINFDGAVFKETEEAGLGVVVRDSHGQVLASLAEKITLPSSSDEVEALAAVRAFTLAMDLNLPSFIVEGDSEVVISALRKEEESLSSFGHLISSIK